MVIIYMNRVIRNSGILSGKKEIVGIDIPLFLILEMIYPNKVGVQDINIYILNLKRLFILHHRHLHLIVLFELNLCNMCFRCFLLCQYCNF